MRLPEKIRVRLLKKHSLPFSTEVNGLNSHLYQFSNKLDLFNVFVKWILRWFPHNIRAIMAKIKLPKNLLSMVIFWIKILSRFKLSSWPRERKLNLKLSIFQLKRTFRVSCKLLTFLRSLTLNFSRMLGDFIAGSLRELNYNEMF